MKKLAASLLFVAGIAGVGCGGGGGGGGPITYTLVSDSFDVPAGVCAAMTPQPQPVPASSMSFTLVDASPGDDLLEMGIIPASAGCNFNAAIVDEQSTGSNSDAGPVPAGTYDLFVMCQSVARDCLFSMTWTATY
jgi:hypothetical protein